MHAEAWPLIEQVVRLPGDYVTHATALWFGSYLWAYLFPHALHVLQCLASVKLMDPFHALQCWASVKFAKVVRPGAEALPFVKQVMRLPGDHVTPAAALWFESYMWAYLSARSFHVLQCLASSLPTNFVLMHAEAWPFVEQVARLPGDYVTPAAALWFGSYLWAYLSPNSFHVLQCLAASVPVMSGYAQTKREAATGKLAPGAFWLSCRYGT